MDKLKTPLARPAVDIDMSEKSEEIGAFYVLI
jgi:hypothetical protein